MEIPNKIRLLNQDIHIVYDDDYCNGKGILGEADINHNKIKLCSRFDGEQIPEDRILHTLFHELIHCILFMIGQTEVYKHDEILTDNLGTAIEDLILNNFTEDGTD